MAKGDVGLYSTTLGGWIIVALFRSKEAASWLFATTVLFSAFSLSFPIFFFISEAI
ncbi:DUF2834 domain-containing protein [Candidatus Saccharibacteria bacterium CPR2]|nr:DUF2834 domain-containing protein [Candidatus Saccharibacteria bacterium CPR2]